MQGRRVERLGIREDGEWYLAEFAVDGRRVEPFWVHKSHREKFSTEQEFINYLERSAVTVSVSAQNPEWRIQ